jgi:hypothetical protein
MSSFFLTEAPCLLCKRPCQVFEHQLEHAVCSTCVSEVVPRLLIVATFREQGLDCESRDFEQALERFKAAYWHAAVRELDRFVPI